MFVLANLINALANLLSLVLTVYMWIIIARALISWVNPDPSNPIVRFLYRVTEPVLRPVRHRLPTLAMGLDLSPLVVILGIYLLEQFLVGRIAEQHQRHAEQRLPHHAAHAVRAEIPPAQEAPPFASVRERAR